MLKENAQIVWDYVKAHDGENFTAQDIEAATGIAKKSVDGIITAAFQRKHKMKRIPADIQLEDGSVKSVKFIALTDEGRVWDPNAEEPKEG